MKKIVFFKAALLWAAFSFAWASTLAQNGNTDWKQVLDSAGIRVFVSEDAASHEVSCKIVTELPASLPEVMAFMRDFRNYSRWIPVYESSELVRKASENDLYGYVVYRPEFALVPGKRVDAVFRLLIEQVGENWVGNFAAVPGELPEKEGFIRQPYFSTNWALVKRRGATVFTYTAKVELLDSNGYSAREYVQNNLANIVVLRAIFDAVAH